MNQRNPNHIPVTFVNIFTRQNLGQAELPALPVARDIIYLSGREYEVAHREWSIGQNGELDIVIMVRPQFDAQGERPFHYAEETQNG